MMWVMDPRLSVVVHHEGKPAGVIVCIPDLNPFVRACRSRLSLTTPWHFLKHRLTGDRAVIIYYSVAPAPAGRRPQRRDAEPAGRGGEIGRLPAARHDLDRRRQSGEPAADAAARREAAASVASVPQAARRRIVIDSPTDLLRTLVAEARLAPSVHNVQPSRWRLAGNRLLLLGDPSRAIPVADPAGRDWRLSHGAHLEGLALALAARGAAARRDRDAARAAPAAGGLVPIAECAVAADTARHRRSRSNAHELARCLQACRRRDAGRSCAARGGATTARL